MHHRLLKKWDLNEAIHERRGYTRGSKEMRMFPSTFSLSLCLGFPQRECIAGISCWISFVALVFIPVLYCILMLKLWSCAVLPIAESPTCATFLFERPPSYMSLKKFKKLEVNDKSEEETPFFVKMPARATNRQTWASIWLPGGSYGPESPVRRVE